MMIDKSPIFIDTNVLIRATIGTAPDHIESSDALRLLWDNNVNIWISRQIIREYAATLTRPQPYTTVLPSALVANEIEIISNQFVIADDTSDSTQQLLTLLTLRRKYQKVGV